MLFAVFLNRAFGDVKFGLAIGDDDDRKIVAKIPIERFWEPSKVVPCSALYGSVSYFARYNAKTFLCPMTSTD